MIEETFNKLHLIIASECYLEENIGWPGNDVGEKIENVETLGKCRYLCWYRYTSRFTWRGPESKPKSNRNSCYCKRIEGDNTNTKNETIIREKETNVFSGWTECCVRRESRVSGEEWFHRVMQCEDGSCEYRSTGHAGGCGDSKWVLDKHCGHAKIDGKFYWNYRCDNGQCIPNDGRYVIDIVDNYRWAYNNGVCDCIDGSDEENPKDCPNPK